MKKYSIVIPAGSGKTTLSKKYKNLYDIDSFHTDEDRKLLYDLYKKICITNDWNYYNNYEINLIKDRINKLKEPYVILLHCKEKSDLLNLKYIGSCKISKKINIEIAKKRGKVDKLYEIMTINNWNNIDTNIFNSFQEINNYILNLLNKYNIQY